MESYKVPTMADVRNAKGSNGFSMVSTFSGCGGACLGYELSGFDLRWANEFVPAAQDTYRANHPDVILDGRDVRTITGEAILKEIGLGVGELDLFEGSPPCSPFSTAGSLDKGWGKVKSYSDKEQRSDDLFFEYSRLIGEIQPKVFVAENVSGLVKGKAIGYFREILRDLKSKGYVVDARLLDASYLGVPQARQRVIFIGVREDLANKFGVTPVFPKPFKKVWTLGEILRDAPKIEEKDGTYFDPETDGEIGLLRYAVGREWDRTPVGSSSDKYFQLVKPALDRPVPTIVATAGTVGAASVTHPIEKRKFTVAEIRTLFSFPKDFVLTGNYSQRVERMGRSVPPLMAKAIGDVIRDEILRKIPNA